MQHMLLQLLKKVAPKMIKLLLKNKNEEEEEDKIAKKKKIKMKKKKNRTSIEGLESLSAIFMEQEQQKNNLKQK